MEPMGGLDWLTLQARRVAALAGVGAAGKLSPLASPAYEYGGGRDHVAAACSSCSVSTWA